MSKNLEFNALVNITVSLSVNEIPELKQYQKNKFKLDHEANPQITETDAYRYFVLYQDTTVKFGQNAVVDDNGMVLVYPISIYEKYGTRLIEFPNSEEGEIGNKFRNLANQINDPEIKKLLKNSIGEKQLNNRFLMKPVFQKLN